MFDACIAQATDLLVWYNAIFVTIFCVGFFFTFLQLLGLGGEASADTDVDADVSDAGASEAAMETDFDHDVEADVHTVHANAASAGTTAAQLLGLGKVPLSIAMMVLCYTVGLAGFLGNQWIAGRFGSPEKYFALNLLAALVAGWLSLRVVGGFLARYVPSFSSSAVGPRELVGLTAKAILPVSSTSGLVSLHDRHGTLHTVRCCTDGPGAIKKGEQVVLTRYLADRNIYVVGRA